MNWLKKIIMNPKLWAWLIPTVIAGAALFKTCQQTDINKEQTEHLKEQERKIENLTYYTNAFSHRPQIEIVGQPIIDSAFQLITAMYLDTTYQTSSKNSIEGYTFIKYRLRLFNNSDYNANIVMTLEASKETKEPMLRTILDTAVKNKNKKIVEYKNGEFSKQLKARDSMFHECQALIPSLESDTIILHCLIVYFGENNVLYDTYYWSVYKIPPMKIIGHNIRQLKLPFTLAPQPPSALFRFKEDYYDTKYYSLEFALKVNEYLE
jgi:hypothetical protein